MEQHPPTDQELIASYRNGDTDALEALFHRHKNVVFNFCFKILRNRAEAEDATSEVFMALITKTYEIQNAKFTTWLLTVARNQCLSRLRQLKRVTPLGGKNAATDEFEPLDVPDESDSPAQKLQAKEAAALLHRAVGALPRELKEALILREFQYLSYEEIAVVLHCSLPKVKILIYRAREYLRANLPLHLKGGMS